jgi:hypothetical protein
LEVGGAFQSGAGRSLGVFIGLSKVGAIKGVKRFTGDGLSRNLVGLDPKKRFLLTLSAPFGIVAEQ